MDKLIVIIVLYYVFKHLFRFLTTDQERRKGTTPHPPSGHYQPPHRPPVSPASKGGRGTPHTPDFPKNLREFGQILKDLKWEAEIPRRTGIQQRAPRQVFPQVETGVKKKAVQKRPPSDQRERPGTREEVRGDDTEPMREERATIPFDQPESFLHGIILSEILRPPISMRVPRLPPYMR